MKHVGGWLLFWQQTIKERMLIVGTHLKRLFGNGIFLQTGDHFQYRHHVMYLEKKIKRKPFMFK